MIKKENSYLLNNIKNTKNIIKISKKLNTKKFILLKNIIFYKHQFQKNINLFYNKAVIFLLFSLGEGLSMVQLQATASGLPIISVYNTGGKKIVDNGVNGFIFPIRNINLLKKNFNFIQG